ncbi:hypothetical protein ABE41_006750 [Fictibacillus arsenicus]|uniref:Uncharacterized protein n=1 Tax=Fictibacillus arsenicus TaxID=255247 RepID=A0A1B1Z2L7_9BACL|nr:hypothetical protein [Fictibacillus arsenicus]ANX11702.1 hypothetical protein ABE41_006750 [Fictibacillus arsenicus]
MGKANEKKINDYYLFVEYIRNRTRNAKYMALRTEVILMGHPVASLTTGIIEDEFHNEVDKEKFAELNAKAYTLTKPPVERATQGKLRNYRVRKVGFLYFAEYYGEG